MAIHRCARVNSDNMSIIRLLLVYFILTGNLLYGQKYSGFVQIEKTGKPIEYVNIGIVGKNIGTVSDLKGEYALVIDSLFDSDTLRFSCIGYYPFSIKVSDFKKLKNYDIYLEERIFDLAEVIVHHKNYRPQTLGIKTKSKAVQSGFGDNKLGYECGILMKIEKSAILEKVNINFSYCSYDTILYRVNVYEVIGKMKFENILENPIYLKLPKDKTSKKVVIDLEPYKLIVQGDFLITMEHVKDLGPGYLYFCAGVLGKTYYRKTSQGKWETAPVGISISVDARVEK